MNHNKTAPIKGFLYSLGGVILLSTNFVTAKYGLKGFNPETFSCVWTTAAAVYAFGIALAGRSSREQIFPRQNMKALVYLGIATGVGMVMTWSGLSILDPVFSAFIWRFYPVLTILLGVLILKERLSKYEVLAMFIMLGGSLWSMAGRWEIVGTGVILTILACCVGAVQLLIAKSQTDMVHPNVLVAYRVGIGAVFTVCWAFGTGMADFDVEARYWLVTLLGAFLGPCASFLLTFRAYRYWSLSQSSIVLTVQPLLVLPLAYIFLASLPTPRELAGGCVILAGSSWLAFIQIRKK
jgi:drug/metabolite transporter (DMT)-like permease